MLIIGCGYMGRLVGSTYASRGETVTGLVRSASSAGELKTLGIQALQVDLDTDLDTALPSLRERLFYFAPPPPTGTTDPRIRRTLARFAAQGQPRRIVYISTTGVYGDCQGAWIDETRPLHPQANRARRRADAETALRTWATETGGELVILRVAGIYGPGKLPLERLRKRLAVVRDSESPYTNRIHAEDLRTVCVAAMERGTPGQAYNACDGHPGTMADYFRRLASLTGLPQPPEISLAEATGQLSPGMLSYMTESRRLSNRRMLEDLAVKLQYPDLERGITASL